MREENTTLTKFPSIFVLGLFLIPNFSLASYAPGETLNPSCGPTDVDCTISPVTLVSSGGTGIDSFSVGDILYASGTTTLSQLGIAPDGRVLKISGGLPYWGNDAGGTDFLASEQGLHLDTLTDTFDLYSMEHRSLSPHLDLNSRRHIQDNPQFPPLAR